MADYDFPPELLDAQRDYYAADARVREATAKLPTAAAIVAGEAEITEEQRTELEAARAERLKWIDVLYEHPWFKDVDDPHAARTALQKAAAKT